MHPLLRAFLCLLWPAGCLSCGRHLDWGRHPLGLCPACHARLTPLPPTRCSVCSLPLPAASIPAGHACAACSRHPPAFDRLLAGWLYRPPLDRVIYALKFRRLDYLGTHLATALLQMLRAEIEEVEIVVPVPLHWARRLRRGYNQAESIARPLARGLGLPLCRALRRRRPTPPQRRLGRDRRLANLQHAFRLRRPQRIRGRRCLLVDDVATTGTTADAAAAVLKGAGATRVVALTAGRTPADGPAADPPGAEFTF